MPRKPKPEKHQWAVLKPKELTNGKWQVSLGVELVDGKRKNPRRIFANNADALQFCRDELARRSAHGQITAGADGVKVAAWLELEEKLQRVGAGSLKEVGERVLRDTEAITQHSAAGECLSRYLSYRGMSVYADDSRGRCNHFIKWFGADKPIREATTEVMKAYFSKHTGATLRRTVSAWFGWAVDEGYLPSNPCAKTKRRRGTKKKKKREAVILSPTDASALLRAAAQAEDWTSLSFIALSLFAGIRPMEFRKKFKGSPAIYLEWLDVTTAGIAIGPKLSKTAARVIPILDPLPLWLEFIRKKRGTLSGPVVATGKRGGGWRKHWEAFLADHWKREWHADQMRHSFGSYRMALVQNADQVAFVMGNTAQVVLDYYWNWKTKAPDAEIYWSLTPEVVMRTGQAREIGMRKMKT